MVLRILYQFPGTAIANNHDLEDLNNRSSFSQSRELEAKNRDLGRAMSQVKVSGKNLSMFLHLSCGCGQSLTFLGFLPLSLHSLHLIILTFFFYIGSQVAQAGLQLYVAENGLKLLVLMLLHECQNHQSVLLYLIYAGDQTQGLIYIIRLAFYQSSYNSSLLFFHILKVIFF